MKGRILDGSSYEFPDKGYVNYLKSLLPRQIEPRPTGISDACAVDDLDDRLGVVAEILKTDREHPESLLFIESAQFVNPYAACRDAVKKTIENGGQEYIQLFPNQPRPLLWFGDEEHLTQFGATAASIETALILAERMDTSADQQQLDFYRQFVFDAYDLDIGEEYIRLELLSADRALVEDLIFNWTVAGNGEEALSVQEAGKTEVEFSLLGDVSEYFIRVVIHDQDGRYYLRGGFDLSELPAENGEAE